MLFSKIFEITKGKEDDWFDPILIEDTQVFIDPMLLSYTEDGFFKNSSQKIISYFEELFQLAAATLQSPKSPRYIMLKNRANFKEVKELCLGYSSGSTDGSGSGSGMGDGIISAIYDSIALGLTDATHFEQLGIFNRGIGCDRISDISARIIIEDIIKYTQYISQLHNLSLKNLGVRIYDHQRNRWAIQKFDLPENPYYPDRAILLIPKRFLSNLPSIDPKDFFDYCIEAHDDVIRSQFSDQIISKLNKQVIIDLAREHPDWIKEYVKCKDRERKVNQPYDFDEDPSSLYSWAEESIKYAKKNLTSLTFKDEKSFITSVEGMINKFINYIENEDGYELLWSNNRGRAERFTQLLLYGIVHAHCEASNIDMSREPNHGRGPVDYKFSQGYQLRVLIEIKLARNSSFRRNLRSQLSQYLSSARCKIGYYLIVCYTDEDIVRAREVEHILNEINLIHQDKKMNYFLLDARNNKPSASEI